MRLTDKQLTEVLQTAKELGFLGFSGNCFSAAIAINTVLFKNKGTLIGGFNEKFFDSAQILIGHLAVEINTADGKQYWDADGYPKDIEDIESWGMLDETDVDYQKLATQHGFTLDEQTANNVALLQFDCAQELLDMYVCCEQDILTASHLLQKALELVLNKK